MGKLNDAVWMAGFCVVYGLGFVIRSPFIAYSHTHRYLLRQVAAAKQVEKPVKRSRRLRRRRRALTDPLPPPKNRIFVLSPWIAAPPQVTYHQEQSGFFAILHEDIRLEIYRMLLEGRTFHLEMDCESAPPHRAECLRKAQMVDAAHSMCWRQRKPAWLLPLLLTCRRTYTETITGLYKGNTFLFTQPFCLLGFLRTLPQHRHTSLRRLEYTTHIEKSLIDGSDRRQIREWLSLCHFLGTTFNTPQLELRLDFQPSLQASHSIQRAEDLEQMQSWLLPLWRLSEKVHLILSIPQSQPSGSDGFGSGWERLDPPQMSVVVDFDEIKRSEVRANRDKVLMLMVHDQIKEALRNRRFG